MAIAWEPVRVRARTKRAKLGPGNHAYMSDAADRRGSHTANAVLLFWVRGANGMTYSAQKQ